LALVALNAAAAASAIKATFDNVSFTEILQSRFGETRTARAHLRRGVIEGGSRDGFTPA
jgi:hypothetical protein